MVVTVSANFSFPWMVCNFISECCSHSRPTCIFSLPTKLLHTQNCNFLSRHCLRCQTIFTFLVNQINIVYYKISTNPGHFDWNMGRVCWTTSCKNTTSGFLLLMTLHTVRVLSKIFLSSRPSTFHDKTVKFWLVSSVGVAL